MLTVLAILRVLTQHCGWVWLLGVGGVWGGGSNVAALAAVATGLRGAGRGGVRVQVTKHQQLDRAVS